MAIDTRELREKRHKLLEDVRAITSKVDAEKRAMLAEERATWDKLYADAATIKSEIDDAERRNEIDREIATAKLNDEERARIAAAEKAKKDAEHASEAEPENYRSTAIYKAAFGKHLTRAALTQEEQRALSAGTGTAGGYLYASETFVQELIKNVTDATIFRQIARVWPAIGQGDSMAMPSLTNRMAAAAWTSELGTPSTDSTLAFGKRRLTPHPLAKEILVSKVLLKKVSMAEAIVREELARVSAEAQENAFLTGTGAQQPLGCFTASADGISTSRDVSTGNTTTSPTFDGLKAAKYSIKQAYWGGLAWLLHRSVMEPIAKLKDGNGRYLLQDSVVAGEPDRLLDFPTRLSEFAPSTLTTGQYVGLLGNFKEGYWIVDSQDIEIAVAEELYVRSNQTLFVMRSGCDGMPVKEECFARVKLA